MPRYDPKVRLVSGILGEQITVTCEICGNKNDVSFHAGQACKIMFKKPIIYICNPCWARRYKEIFNEEWR